MFLLEPNETPYDLRFSIFRIPVRVHPMFWLFSAVLGWNSLQLGIQFLVGWIVLTFVSILIHELGHVWMGMAFGAYGRIVLYSFGGLAVGSNRLANRLQRILVLFAGPFAGFALVAVAIGAQELRAHGAARAYVALIAAMFGIPFDRDQLVALPPASPLEGFLMLQLCFINIAWGLLNLLPVWPLDGGQISREVLDGISPRHGTVLALGLSVAIAALLAVHSILAEYGHSPFKFLPFGGTLTALMFGLLAYQSFQMLQAIQAQNRSHDDRWR